MRNIFFVCLLVLLMAFSGCTDISKVAISKIDLKMIDEAGTVVNSLVPGKEYQVKVEIYGADHKVISHPDYRQIEFHSPNLSLTKTDMSRICVVTSRDTWGLLHKGQYEVSISVKDNAFPAQIKKWPVEWKWEQFNTFSYQGKAGKNGSNGYNGSDGFKGHEDFDGNGTDGTDGANGGDGKNGKEGGSGVNTNLIVVFYDITGIAENSTHDTKMLLFYNMDQNTFLLSKVQPFYLNTSGGDGGNGGNGGDGGNGGNGGECKKGVVQVSEDKNKDKDNVRLEVSGHDGAGGNGGNGGIGGDGGNGGDAGNITIWCYDQSVLDFIHTTMKGGRGGLGGSAGIGGKPGAGRIYGMRGNSPRNKGIYGLDGHEGKYTIVQKSFEEITELLKNAHQKEFDSTRLIRTR